MYVGLLEFVQRRFTEAEAQFRKTLELAPDFYKADYQLGLTAENLGRFAEAAAHYQRVLRVAPDHLAALAALLSLRDFEPDAHTVSAAEDAATREDIPAPEYYTLRYALAKRFDRQGDFLKASHHLLIANQRRGKFTHYEPKAVETMFGAQREVFTRSLVQRLAPYGSASERPVFVVGMPRTGTTLTEQILSAHPSVFGAGELADIPRIASRLPAVMTQALGRAVLPYPHCAEKLNPAFMQVMVDYYLHALNRHDTRAPRAVDKNPFNFAHLGLIAVLFPKARIIHCRRNPLDVGLSCAMELFELKQDFTTDFASFAHYYAQYTAMMAHWKHELDIPILDVAYESLVADAPRVSREIVSFCGLPWDDRCLRHQQTDRAVLTPSKWQVRQPIYRSSVGRWRNYEAYLQPLRSAFAAHGVAAD